MAIFDEFVIEDLMAPIPGPSDVGVGSGPDFDRKFDELVRLEQELNSAVIFDSHSDLQAMEQEFAANVKWSDLYKKCKSYLISSGKDLRVVYYLVESMVQLGSEKGCGPEGLRLGLETLATFIERYRDTGFPRLDDLEWSDVFRQWSSARRIRIGSSTAKVSEFSFVVLKMKTYGDPASPQSMLSYIEFMALPDDVREDNRSGFRAEDLRAQDEILSRCQELVDRINAIDPNQPALYDARDCIDWIRKETSRAGAAEPAGIVTTADTSDVSERPNDTGESLQESSSDGAETSESERTATAGSTVTAIAIPDAEHALRMIVEAASFLRKESPQSPMAYLISRSIAMSRFYEAIADSDSLRSDTLAAPDSSMRSALNQMARDGQWEELSERAESVMATPEAVGWLDLHRLADTAIQESGKDAVLRATRSMLRAWLSDYPAWPRASFLDETSCASKPTIDWLRRTFETPTESERKLSDTGSATPVGQHEPVELLPIDRAKAMLKNDDWDGALAVMAMAIRSSECGRDRFLRRLELAELFAAREEQDKAQAILSELYGELQKHGLIHWEQIGPVTRLLSALYRSFEDKTTPLAKEVVARLMSVDPIAAMQATH